MTPVLKLRSTALLSRVGIFLAGLLFLAPYSASCQEGQDPKDRPPITFERSGDFSALIRELEQKASTEIQLAKGIEAKHVEVKVKQGGFYDVLDALCKAHGGVSYLDTDRGYARMDSLVIQPRPWVEWPAVYQGHFKVMVARLVRTHHRSVEGKGSWVDVTLWVIGPPWLYFSSSAQYRSEFTLKEVRDSNGKGVLAESDESFPNEFFSTSVGSDGFRCMAGQTVRLRDYDLEKGLQILSGNVGITVSTTDVVRVPAEAGKSVAIPGATLNVDSVSDISKEKDGSTWQLNFTVKPDKGSRLTLEDFLEESVRWDNDRDNYLRFAGDGMSFEAKAWSRKGPPAWAEFRALGLRRTVQVPFQFKDLAFKKGKP